MRVRIRTTELDRYTIQETAAIVGLFLLVAAVFVFALLF